MDFLGLVTACAIAVAPGTAPYRSDPTSSAFALCHGNTQHLEIHVPHLLVIGSATVDTSSLPPPLEGAAQIAPPALPGGDLPPVLRAIQESDEARRQQNFERSGGALFPASGPTDHPDGAPAGEASTAPSSAVPPAAGSQTELPPDALFVPLGTRRSQR